ncbi:MAG TPA: hypothetical protein VL068_07550 [Microthrixaceae bacterium]|nr:hypothetical protein [Microthrixaceae bacterium]
MSEYPAGSTPSESPTGPSQRKSNNAGLVIAVVTAAVIGIVIVVLLMGASPFGSIGLKHADDLKEPPSARREQERDPVGGSSTPTNKPKGFKEASCVFSGTSSLTPGLDNSLLGSASEQKMELEPGASFKCKDEFGDSSGTASMSAKFPSLSAIKGIGAGPGVIEWDVLPLGAPGNTIDGPRKSNTHNEVELILPEIVVWITIVDGPYAGHKGKLVLNDWELIQDISGTITGLRFNPTDFKLGPQ